MNSNQLTDIAIQSYPKKGRWKKFISNLIKYKYLYLMLIPGIIHYIIFRYVPLTGILIAFQDFNLFEGIMGSPFVGMKHFVDIFSSDEIWKLIRNTFLLGSYSLLFSLPTPIFFAIVLNEVKYTPFKKLAQSISYFPSLISTVVVVSMVIDFLSPSTGIINTIIAKLGFEKHYFMADPKWFRTIYVASGVWQKFGYSAIVYLSTINSISTELYEAAEIDGCSRLKRIWHVTLPGLLPTICTMTILNAGSIFKIGADKVILLYNPLTYETADVFGSFVYRRGILESNYSYSAAAGLFESIVAVIMIVATNKISKKVSETSLW